MEGEVNSPSNVKGLLAFSFGLTSLILSVMQIGTQFGLLIGIFALVFGVVGIIMSSKQNKILRNDWSKAGKILSWTGIIISIILLALLVIFTFFILPDFLAQQAAQGGF